MVASFTSHEDFSRRVADKLREVFGSDSKAAFHAFKGDKSVLSQLEHLQKHMPPIEYGRPSLHGTQRPASPSGRAIFRSSGADTELGLRVLEEFLEGFRESQRSGPVAYGESQGPKLAFDLISDPVKVARAQGIVQVPDVLLTASELRRGIESLLGIPCGASQAEAIIRSFDSSGYLSRDGRMTLQDFERMFVTGRDRLGKLLQQAAAEIVAEETQHTMAKRLRAEAAAERARRAAEAAGRRRVQSLRDEFEATWLLRRLQVEATAAEESHARAQASIDGGSLPFACWSPASSPPGGQPSRIPRLCPQPRPGSRLR